MKTSPVIALAAVALVGAGAVWYTTWDPASPPATSIAAAEAQDMPDAGGESGDAAASSVEEMTLGDPDAPVQVIEYASFTCPHCATFNEEVWPQIKANYVDTGRIGFTHREVYFDRFGLWAGMLARCGGDTQKYFAIGDMIYERQREWTQGAPAEIAQNLRTIGKTAGLGTEQLESCMNDGAKAEALVANYERNAEADGIESTPSFIIDGQKYSNMSYDEFAEILDGRLSDTDS